MRSISVQADPALEQVIKEWVVHLPVAMPVLPNQGIILAGRTPVPGWLTRADSRMQQGQLLIPVAAARIDQRRAGSGTTGRTRRPPPAPATAGLRPPGAKTTGRRARPPVPDAYGH
jgi:hypothetical protein